MARAGGDDGWHDDSLSNVLKVIVQIKEENFLGPNKEEQAMQVWTPSIQERQLSNKEDWQRGGWGTRNSTEKYKPVGTCWWHCRGKSSVTKWVFSGSVSCEAYPSTSSAATEKACLPWDCCDGITVGRV